MFHDAGAAYLGFSAQDRTDDQETELTRIFRGAVITPLSRAEPCPIESLSHAGAGEGGQFPARKAKDHGAHPPLLKARTIPRAIPFAPSLNLAPDARRARRQGGVPEHALPGQPHRRPRHQPRPP